MHFYGFSVRLYMGMAIGVESILGFSVNRK